jgi:hypothetical protein
MSGGVGGGSREVSPYPDFDTTGTSCQERESSLPAIAQNDIGEEVVISSEARNPKDDALEASRCGNENQS